LFLRRSLRRRERGGKAIPQDDPSGDICPHFREKHHPGSSLHRYLYGQYTKIKIEPQGDTKGRLQLFNKEEGSTPADIGTEIMSIGQPGPLQMVNQGTVEC